MFSIDDLYYIVGKQTAELIRANQVVEAQAAEIKALRAALEAPPPTVPEEAPAETPKE